MSSKREYGQVQPGIKWGPFVIRIPFVHLRLSLPDMLQGIAVAGATGLALVPYFTNYLGLTFEEAVTMAMFHSVLISMSWFMFGDPYAPGWLTPAIPFVIQFILLPAYNTDHTLQFQAMTALTLDFTFILILLGVTGLGAKLVKWVPNVLKGGIILGAAVAAFLRVTSPGDAANVFAGTATIPAAPIAGSCAIIICLVFAFSKPMQTIAATNKWMGKLLSFGLLPGFLVAGVVGLITGEFDYNIRNGILDVPASAMGLWQKASPLVIGWPPLDMFGDAFVLALITYILFFGDVVTGNEMIEHAKEARPDEKLDINPTRAHLATGIRNAIMAVIAPFFTTQGVLWTGIQVILLKRWAHGREKVDSFFDVISSFYVFGVPILFVVLPIVTLLQPLLPVALAITLILTAFACATLALSLVKDATERGAMVITAMAFGVLHEPWQGLLIGFGVILALCGWKVFIPSHEIDDFGPVHEHAPPPTQATKQERVAVEEV